MRFITTLVDQIRQRISDNINHSSSGNTTLIGRKRFVRREGAIDFSAMAVPPETIEKIQNQWSKITLLDWKQISSTQSWCEVHSYKDAYGENPFAELA
ncbi:hypothetical protein HPB48_001727 [Haemaphysalis longicornis]|uniref:Uncharacterized protein n=1 Tax=Haemaphysalis longicornis TaxID=44386 RepID=A0A9J6FPV8_HAELO|nr:hypothetical protein HPB48_001727 [Haemaphysalis longicornis]